MRHNNDMISENRESEKDWESAVRRILADPGFARNVRGRLISATRLLPARLHPELACDYAGHVVRICENASGGNRCFRNMIARIREFLRGGSAEKVISARSDLFDLHYHLKRHSDVKKRIASEASWTIAIAVNVCCQRELETLGGDRPQPPSALRRRCGRAGMLCGGPPGRRRELEFGQSRTAGRCKETRQGGIGHGGGMAGGTAEGSH
ncbi:hypothetical protein QUF72_16475 [Desulfobacterales bacterium HSG2]|nr:hypothetical protein [Desulfobacterales bacterium HSG2]